MRITLRNFRVIIAVALGGAVVWATAPYATSYVSSNAVVNAPLNTVLSPMQGRITQRSPPVGTGVAAGAPLVTVEVKERDRRYLEDLRARLAMLGENLASAEVEAAKLAAMEEVLSARIRSYRTRTLERLAAVMREAEAALAAAEAGRDNAAATLRRAETLVRQGHATAMRAEADAAAHSEAVAEVSRLRARLERVGIEAGAAAAGTFVREGWNDVPYSQQRLDGIVLKLAALTAERRRTASERTALARQITVEQQLIAERETFSPVAPSAGVIWKQSGAVGETVVPGDVLVQMVDCDARFVEVTLAERHFGDIAPGDAAWVRLKGGGEAVLARVSAVLGAGAKFDHPRLAASVNEVKTDQLRVLVSLRDAGIDGEPGDFCHVGRTAEVRFERRDLGVLRGMAQAVGARLLALFAEPELAATLTGPAAAHRPGH
ncbi:MAG: HlyD family efflux transporter periplasmic adaptor subunit [Limibaculum sp.]